MDLIDIHPRVVRGGGFLVVHLQSHMPLRSTSTFVVVLVLFMVLGRLSVALWSHTASKTCSFIPKTRQSFQSINRYKMSTSAASSRVEGGEEDQILVDNMNGVKERMANAALQAERDPSSVRLVAVSKTKPNEDILALYRAGQRHFGENYFQEFSEKASVLPLDIKWHFIGHLQSSKANKLLRDVPSLYMVETVDSEKLAGKLQSACIAAERTEPLKVLLQVDTSGEDTKSGITTSEVPALARYILDQCPQLQLAGVMTIGAPGDLTCFDRLVEAKEVLQSTIGHSDTPLELSMGMSGDFEAAIQRGATSVRVGSTIFGPRAYPPKST